MHVNTQIFLKKEKPKHNPPKHGADAIYPIYSM